MIPSTFLPNELGLQVGENPWGSFTLDRLQQPQIISYYHAFSGNVNIAGKANTVAHAK